MSTSTYLEHAIPLSGNLIEFLWNEVQVKEKCNKEKDHCLKHRQMDFFKHDNTSGRGWYVSTPIY